MTARRPRSRARLHPAPASRAGVVLALLAVLATGRVAAQTLGAGAAAPAPAGPASATPRRPGSDYMSPALQALQRDDAQNPAQLWVVEGRQLWQRAAANGQRCATCHALTAGTAPRHLADAAARHPAWDASRGRPITLPARIDQCRVQHLGLPSQGPDGDEVLALGALLAQQSRGQPIQASTAPGMAPWVARGQSLWQARLGQLNLACMHCHDQRAGQRLGGAPIPQAHPTGYPLYRLEWQTLGSLQRRLRGCLVGVRAEAWAPQADEWLALESFLARRADGMTHEGAALRP